MKNHGLEIQVEDAADQVYAIAGFAIEPPCSGYYEVDLNEDLQAERERIEK